jgi:asparagine synthase (glutamine-hydrolysing)
MCGICGIAIPSILGRSVDEARLVRMRDTMIHRGPDGAGMLIDGHIGLGHRRLSIVDVAHGAQPMTTDDGRSTIVYNGEVFNHPMLMADLKKDGVQYHTTCDTETVLHLYERHGRDFVSHCRGMFAIAIWDRQQRTLTLARDRFGVKPVYYVHQQDGTLHFASEIKALLASGAVSAELNRNAFPDFLANHAPSGNETLYAGVKRLPPGHTLVWHDGEITFRQYWDLQFTPDATLAGRSDAQLVEEYSARFEEAVRLRLMADVPLGMFLSGGIDSSAITAAMSTMVDGPIKTFSVAFAEREANEFAYARMVSARYKTEHHEITVSPGDFWAALPRLIWHEDEPIAHPSSVALNFVSNLAAEHVKVVLTGEGSDETLAGYNRYRVTIANMRLGGMWESALPSGVRSAIAGMIGEPGVPGFRGKLARTFLARPSNLDAMYFDNFAVFAPNRIAAMLTPTMQAQVRGVNAYAAYHDALRRTDAPTLLGKLLYADTKTYLHELLMKQDQMSMAASIESRVPFLDHPLAEFAARMPERMKLRGATTKWVLRQAMQHRLPAEILSRKKMGFPVPVGAWFRGEWRHLLDEFVLSPRVRARGVFEHAALERLVRGHLAGENHSERLWALVTHEIWQRVFFDGESPESIRMSRETATVSHPTAVAA